MGWENRSGRQYYYRKVRHGSTVISEYMGSRELANLFFEMDELDREERAIRLRKWKNEQNEIRTVDAEIAQLNRTLINLVTATLLISGYHPHKGQWRRLRNAE